MVRVASTSSGCSTPSSRYSSTSAARSSSSPPLRAASYRMNARMATRRMPRTPLAGGEPVLDEICEHDHGTRGQWRFPLQRGALDAQRQHERGHSQHQGEVRDVAADDVADRDVELALAGADGRHHHLGSAGPEPDDDGADHDRRDVQRVRQPGCTDDELVGCLREEEQAGDHDDGGDRHRRRLYGTRSPNIHAADLADHREQPRRREVAGQSVRTKSIHSSTQRRQTALG